MANQHIIELNGKRYDALSGKMLTPKHKPAVSNTKTQPTNVDGFMVRPRSVHHDPKHLAGGVHTKTQASKTLMRKSVKRPQPIIKQASASHHVQATPLAAVAAQPHKTFIVPERLARAKQIHQSKLITKFSDGVARAVGQPSVLPLEMAVAPGAIEVGKVATHSSTVSPFQKVLESATSHRQPRLKKARVHQRVAKKLHVSPGIVSVGSSALAILLIAGFIAYQNVPNLAMRVASTRAGVHASLPAYKPAGFAMSGPIQYKPGQITVNFKSNSSDDRNFSITQSASSWNSQTLLENYVAPIGKPYQTYQDKGKTIYIYNGSNATWVDGGIWYNVQGNSSLNSDQLLRIADSL